MHVQSLAVSLIVLFIGGFLYLPFIQNGQSQISFDPPCWPEMNGTLGDNNWYRSSVVVWFNGSFNRVDYRIDGSNWTEYLTSFSIDEEGIHILEWTCDGNMSNIYSAEIKIDTTSPYYSKTTLRWIGVFKWKIAIDVTDDTSGVNRVEFNIANYTDTEPPWEATWRVCLWVHIVCEFVLWLQDPDGYIEYQLTHPALNAWDNAGNCFASPSFK